MHFGLDGYPQLASNAVTKWKKLYRFGNERGGMSGLCWSGDERGDSLRLSEMHLVLALYS